MDNLDKSCGFTLLMLQLLCPTGYGDNSFGLSSNSYATCIARSFILEWNILSNSRYCKLGRL